MRARHRARRLGDHRAAQADLAVIEHHGLAGRDRPVRLRELHRDFPVVNPREPARRVGLAVAGKANRSNIFVNLDGINASPNKGAMAKA